MMGSNAVAEYTRIFVTYGHISHIVSNPADVVFFIFRYEKDANNC